VVSATSRGGPRSSTFFQAPDRRKPGTERNLRQALEDIDRRIRLHTRLAAPLARALSGRRPL
jgi:hypothetical protein